MWNQVGGEGNREEMCFFKRNQRTEGILGRWEGRGALGPRPPSPVLLAVRKPQTLITKLPTGAWSPKDSTDRDVKNSK